MIEVAGILLGCVVVEITTAYFLQRFWDRMPELHDIDDEELKAQITYLAQAAFQPSMSKRLARTGLPLATLAIGYCALSCLGAPDYLFFAGLVTTPPICTTTLVWISRRELRRFIWRKLAERGRLVCLHCGYDLRGQTVCRCPECGKAFDPQRLTLKKGVMYAVDCWRDKE